VNYSSSEVKYNDIEKEIYRVLYSLRNSEIIKISEFLKHIRIKEDFNAKLDFPRVSMLKSLILMKLKSIKSQTELSKFLTESKEDAHNLGFYGENDKILTPNQRSFSHFINHKLTEEEKKFIEFIITKTNEISQKFGIVFDDVESLITRRKEGGTERTLNNRKGKKLRELCRYVKENIYPKIDLQIRSNSIYKKEDYLDILTHITMTKDFTENGCKTYKRIKSSNSPVARTLLYHLRKYDEWNTVQQIFIRLFDHIYKLAIKIGILDRRKSYDIALDFTDIPHYGNINNNMVVGTKPSLGTSYAYKYATINIVEEGRRFTLIALPVGPLSSYIKIVERLLAFTKDRIKIRKLYADRYFFKSNVINLFKKMGITFLMPVTGYSKIRKWINRVSAPRVIENYEMGKEEKAVFNIVLVEDEHKNKLAYATNMNISNNDTQLIGKIISLYKKRWGIETSFRVKKRNFFARTTSKNYTVRFFYFMFSVLLYNLWILIDSIIALHLFGKLLKNHIVTSKLFGTFLYMIRLVT
jgi:putative transposase